ncbi:MAG: O-antigen ligase family protein [bacterium]
MKRNQSFLFYCGILIYFLMIYRSSWFPGGGVIMSFDIYIIDLILYSVILFFFSFDKIYNYQFRLNINNFFLYLLFLLFLTSTLGYNDQELTSIKNLTRLISYIAYICLFFFWFPELFVSNNKYFIKLISIIIYLGFFTSVIGLFLLFTGQNPVSQFSDSLISIITHPNNASIIFTYTSITTLFFLLYNHNRLSSFKKKFLIISIGLQVIAQLYSFTRAGIIATMIGLTLFLLLYYRKKFLIILPVLILTLPSFLYYFIFSKKGFGSFISRFYLLIPAYHMITDNDIRMLWGYGVTEAFTKYKEYKFLFNVTEENINDPHNTYVMLILMFGLLFTILLLIFLLSLLIRGFNSLLKLQNKKESLIYTYLISVIIAICIQGIFDSELIMTEYYTFQILLSMTGLLYLLKKDRSNIKKLTGENS